MAMSSATVQDHYRDIASNYDYFYRERNDAVIDLLLTKLSLQPHHVVADIGSGTGYIVERLFLSANLRNPIWCIDPCAEMQEQAKKRKGVLPMQMTASEFFAKPDLSCRFDRVISVASCHHLSYPLEVYKGIKRSLNPGGVCMLIFGTGVLTDYPLFSRVTSLNVSSSLLSPEQHHYHYLQEAGFEVTFSEVPLNLSMEKAKWYEMLRGKWLSMLRQLTTQEIEEGIEELENGKLKDVKFDEFIHISQTEGILEAITHE